MHIHTCDCPGVCPTHPPTHFTFSCREPTSPSAQGCLAHLPGIPWSPQMFVAVPPHTQLFCQMLGNFPTPPFSKLLKPESGNTPLRTAPDHLLLFNREVTSAVASWHPCPLRNRRTHAEVWQWRSR